MPEIPARTPKEDLNEAIDALIRLSIAHIPASNMPRAKFFIDAIEADLDFAINPVQLIADMNTKPPKGR